MCVFGNTTVPNITGSGCGRINLRQPSTESSMFTMLRVAVSHSYPTSALNPLQRLCRSFASKRKSKEITVPSLARRKFEEENHLGRGMTKYEFDNKTLSSWKMRVKAKRWNVEPYRLTPQANYEVEALKEIHSRSYSANVLLEVRDVRLPASSHHPSFTRLAKHRLHLVCYTHADMIDAATRDRVEDWTNRSWPGSRSIFVDSREHRQNVAEGFNLVYDSLLKHIEESGGMNTALTVGVSNTGKSSLLLALIRTARARGEIPQKLKVAQAIGKKNKKRRVSKAKSSVAIQDKPGKTREITEYLLREKPRAFFLDVPGMTPPAFFFAERPEAWFGFGAANLLPTGKDVDEDLQIQMSFCDYVLHAMNRDGLFGYVKKLNLQRPTDDLNLVLEAVKMGREGFDQEVLMKQRCKSFLSLFNHGSFGPVILDDISQLYKNFVFKDSHFTKRFHGYERKPDAKADKFDDDDFNFN